MKIRLSFSLKWAEFPFSSSHSHGPIRPTIQPPFLLLQTRTRTRRRRFLAVAAKSRRHRRRALPSNSAVFPSPLSNCRRRQPPPHAADISRRAEPPSMANQQIESTPCSCFCAAAAVICSPSSSANRHEPPPLVAYK